MKIHRRIPTKLLKNWQKEGEKVKTAFYNSFWFKTKIKGNAIDRRKNEDLPSRAIANSVLWSGDVKGKLHPREW